MNGKTESLSKEIEYKKNQMEILGLENAMLKLKKINLFPLRGLQLEDIKDLFLQETEI